MLILFIANLVENSSIILCMKGLLKEIKKYSDQVQKEKSFSTDSLMLYLGWCI